MADAELLLQVLDYFSVVERYQSMIELDQLVGFSLDRLALSIRDSVHDDVSPRLLLQCLTGLELWLTGGDAIPPALNDINERDLIDVIQTT